MDQEYYDRLENEFLGIRDEKGVHANTAVRIGTAFLDLLRMMRSGDFDEITFNKVLNKPTFLQGLIALGSIIFGEYADGLKGGIITEEGVAELKDLWVREHVKAGDGTRHYDDAGKVIPALEVKGDSTFTGNLSSPEFVSAFFGGLGWAIQKKEVVNPAGEVEYKYHLEIDDVTIRNTLRVFEMIICQLLGENANRYFSDQMEVDHYDAETGRIMLKTGNGRLYNPFRVGDLVEVQQFNGKPSEKNDYYVTKHYEMRITAVGLGSLDDGADRLDWVEFDRFTTTMENGTPDKLIGEFDTIVRADSDRDKNRKGLVTVMAVGENTPYMDILYGMKTDPQHALKGRLGNLEGVGTDLFGWLEGFGAYINNLYGVGKFFNYQTGESLTASMRATRELFQRVYSETIYNVSDEDNFVSNGFFQHDLTDWEVCNVDGSAPAPEQETQFLGIDEGDGASVIQVNGSPMAVSNRLSAQMEEKDGIRCLHLLGMGVAQDFSKIKANTFHEVMESGMAEDMDTVTVPDRLYMGVRILPLTAGRLSVMFRKANGGYSGWERDIDQDINWQLLQAEDDSDVPWDFTGSGRLIVCYTGECYIRFVALTTDAVANSREQFSTMMEQTSRHIEFQARKQSADLNEAVADFTIKYDRITQTVTDNWRAFQNAKSTLEGEVSRIDTAIADYNSANDGRWASFATWQSQTNTSISSFAMALTVDGQIMSMSSVVQTFRQIQQTVADNWSAWENAREALEGEVDRIDRSIYDYNSANDGRWASFATWQSQTNTSISSFATALTVDGQIKSMSSVVQTFRQITQEVSDIDGRVGALSTYADRISGRVSTVEGWGSIISGHTSAINDMDSELGSLQSRVSGIEQLGDGIDMWVSSISSSMNALQNPAEWEDGTVNARAGKSFSECKSSGSGYVRYYQLVPLSVATSAMLNDGYVMNIVFFDSSRKCLTGTVTSTGWKGPDDYGRVTFTNIPGNAAYGAVVIRGVDSHTINASTVAVAGFFLSNDRIVSRAELSLFVDKDSVSWLTGSADNVIFNFTSTFQIQHNGKAVADLDGEGNLSITGKLNQNSSIGTVLPIIITSEGEIQRNTPEGTSVPLYARRYVRRRKYTSGSQTENLRSTDDFFIADGNYDPKKVTLPSGAINGDCISIKSVGGKTVIYPASSQSIRMTDEEIGSFELNGYDRVDFVYYGGTWWGNYMSI